MNLKFLVNVFLWIYKIILWNLRRKYGKVWSARKKRIFPWRHTWVVYLHHWANLDIKFSITRKRANNRQTSKDDVTLRVREITCFPKQKKLLLSALYRFCKNFSPGDPHFEISLQKGMLNITNNTKNARLFANFEKFVMCHKQLKY